MESFAELFEESVQQTNTRPGEVINATVVDITPDFVRLDAGLKSESSIPVEQFKDANGELEVKVGDVVQVVLEDIESGDGENMLSREKAKRNEALSKLE